ncbi:hypothetical protein HZA86_03525 [Candidatus Uhrbacteria bacterium]|nr:hypothetical protein [Candidatus Uhrbacteria bacterium]
MMRRNIRASALPIGIMMIALFSWNTPSAHALSLWQSLRSLFTQNQTTEARVVTPARPPQLPVTPTGYRKPAPAPTRRNPRPATPAYRPKPAAYRAPVQRPTPKPVPAYRPLPPAYRPRPIEYRTPASRPVPTPAYRPVTPAYRLPTPEYRRPPEYRTPARPAPPPPIEPPVIRVQPAYRFVPPPAPLPPASVIDPAPVVIPPPEYRTNPSGYRSLRNRPISTLTPWWYQQ